MKAHGMVGKKNALKPIKQNNVMNFRCNDSVKEALTSHAAQQSIKTSSLLQNIVTAYLESNKQEQQEAPKQQEQLNSLQLSDELTLKLSKRAAIEDRTVNELIDRVLSSYIENHERGLFHTIASRLLHDAERLAKKNNSSLYLDFIRLLRTKDHTEHTVDIGTIYTFSDNSIILSESPFVDPIAYENAKQLAAK